MLSLHRIRFPSSFSLRTLLIGVTAISVWLGCQVNWIRQRHTFLNEQLTRHRETQLSGKNHEGKKVTWQPDPRFLNEWWHEQLATGKPAPWPLRWFGEQGVGRLWVVVRESDVTLRTWGDDGIGRPVKWPEISASQPDYRRAKRLFPEAQIRPVKPNEIILERDGGGSSGWHLPGVTFRDQAKPTTIRLVCGSTTVENTVLAGRFELNAPSDGPVIIDYRTYDGTATTWQGNYAESPGQILAEPGETTFPFTINIGPLTNDQRAAGGATFSIKLDLVIGAVPEVKEKTITIVPSHQQSGTDHVPGFSLWDLSVFQPWLRSGRLSAGLCPSRFARGPIRPIHVIRGFPPYPGPPCRLPATASLPLLPSVCL